MTHLKGQHIVALHVHALEQAFQLLRFCLQIACTIHDDPSVDYYPLYTIYVALDSGPFVGKVYADLSKS